MIPEVIDTEILCECVPPLSVSGVCRSDQGLFHAERVSSSFDSNSNQFLSQNTIIIKNIIRSEEREEKNGVHTHTQEKCVSHYRSILNKGIRP